MLAWLAIARATTHTVASSDELAGLLDGSPILSPGDEIVLTADVVLAMPPPVPITVVGQGPTVVTVAAPLPHGVDVTYRDLTLTGGGPLVALQGAHVALEGVAVEGLPIEVASGAFFALMSSTYHDAPVMVVDGNLLAVGATFLDNHGADGGALSCRINSVCEIHGSSFLENDALSGGAIHLNGGDLIVTDSFFCANAADQRGGAIEAFARLLILERNVFVDHTANRNGVFYLNGDRFTGGFETTVVNDNTFAGAISAVGSPLGDIQSFFAYDFHNNLVVGMAGPPDQELLEGNGYRGGHNLYFGNSGTLTSSPNDLVGVDPRLVDPFSRCASDLRLPVDSPAIDAGNPGIDDDIGALDPVDLDVDQDGLLDSEELALGTNPDDPDTDDDGALDGDEVDAGTDPLVADAEPTTTTGPTASGSTGDTGPAEPLATSSGGEGLAGACGCASPGADGGLWGPLGLALLLWRRRC